MHVRISLCFFWLVLAPTFGSESCKRINEGIFSKLTADVAFLEKGFVELSSFTKDLMWTAMRMEMRLNLLKTELEALRQTSHTTASSGSQSEKASGMTTSSASAMSSVTPANAASNASSDPISAATSTVNSCSLQQLLQEQFKDVSIEIRINPSQNATLKPSESTATDYKEPSRKGEIASCSEASKTGNYSLKLRANVSESVLCDTEFEKGGWVVIQHRFNGSEDFYRNWTDYQNGFGSLNGEFWLGNEKIYQLTAEKPREIVFLMEDFDGNRGIAKYESFKLGDKTEKYALKSLGAMSGSAGDSLSRNVGSKFSTHDMDNDKSASHCAQLYAGGWWYDDCHLSNLNGQYTKGTSTVYAKSMCWSTFKGFYYSLKISRIMVRF